MDKKYSEKINDRVVAKAEDIEEMESPEPLREQVMDIKVTSDLNGVVSEIRIHVDVGGPNIWVNLISGTVGGSWGGKTHKVPIFDEDAKTDVLEPLADHYESQFNMKVIK